MGIQSLLNFNNFPSIRFKYSYSFKLLICPVKLLIVKLLKTLNRCKKLIL